MESKTGKKKQNLKQVHEIFLACAEREELEHWISLFTDCAHGIFPQGVSFKDGTIYHRQKRKKAVKTYKLPEGKEEACKLIKNIFKKDLVQSSADENLRERVIARKQFLESLLPANASWSQIKSAKVKDYLISLFAQTTGKEKEMTRQEIIILERTLNLGILNGQIKTDDIKLSGGAIKEIKGYNTDKKYFKVDVKLTLENTYIPPKASKQISIYEEFVKNRA